MILGRLVHGLDAEALCVIPRAWMTRIFVTGDVISFVMQAGGGGIQSAGSLDMYELGEKIIIVGLFVQIVVFSIFIVISLTFHRNVVVRPSLPSLSRIPCCKRHLYVLYAASFLILVRSIFRVIEYLQGNGGYLISHEAFLYIFDTLLMVAVMVILAIWYVGDLEHSSDLSRDTKTEGEGLGPYTYVESDTDSYQHLPVEMRRIV